MAKNIIKSFLIGTGLDTWVANAYTRSNLSILQKLIPYRDYYTEKMDKKVKRRGVWFHIFPYDYSQWVIFAGSDWGHINAFQHFIGQKSEEGIILDVGANMGQFSLVVGNILLQSKSPKKVIAFEANPNVYKKFSDNLALNPSLSSIVSVNNIGVGEKEGLLEMQVPLRNSGAGSVMRNYEHEPHEKHSVKLVSLDHFLKDSTVPVNYIKLDVENYEYMVLQGAEAMISKWKPTVYIEMGKEQVNQEGILAFFKDKGYQIMLDKENGTYQPISTLEELRNINILYNLVMVYPHP